MSNRERVALVTGANGGIGLAAVKYFSEKNWKVAAVSRSELKFDLPEGCEFFQVDIGDPDQVKNLFEQISGKYGRLDALVNNAAIQIAKPLLDTSIEEWDRLMDVNLRAVFVSVKQAYPLMKKVQGSIVNIASVHAVATSADIASYAASKGAMLALTRAMAIEFAPDNVRVNVVLPGAVDTPMLDAGLSRGHVSEGSLADKKAELASKTVIGRIGTPKEIAHAIYFLADNSKSSFMTGQSMIVDGGATIRLSTE
jgi:glucose 1-dehydrogenase